MNKRVTMKQVAGELGLSRLTVSSVINGKAAERGISKKTARKVLEYLEKRGYVPSRQAVALRSGGKAAIGLLHTGGILFSHLLEAFNRLLAELYDRPDGLEVIVVPKREVLRGLTELVARGVQRIVWLQTGETAVEFASADTIFGLLSNIRTIIYNYRFDEDVEVTARLEELGVHMVGVSRPRAYRTLARFLKRLGHKRVALPDTSRLEESTSITDEQLMSALAKQGLVGLPMRPPLFRAGGPKRTGEKFAAVLAGALKNNDFTAAVFRDDEVAGFAMAELARRGIKVPDQLTVTGFDGIPLADAFRVPMTTLRIPVPAMTAEVIRLLKSPAPPYARCFEVKLHKGASHKRAAGNNPANRRKRT